MKVQPDGTRRVQWGTASNADTTTGQTAATPTDTHQTATSENADADSRPFPSAYREFRQQAMEYQQSGQPLPEFTTGTQGYLVKITREQLETAEVFPLTIGQAESLEERERRQEAVHRGDLLCWEALQDKHPELGPIIKLHKPTDYGECQGCDGGPDYSGDWPCRTISLIEEEY